MKFGKFYKKNKIKKWSCFYIDYKKLKKIIKLSNPEEYLKVIDLELDKLNLFVELINKYSFHKNKISKFLVLNYMAFFKSIKKHDKKFCKNCKLNFFYKIQKQNFYKYYLRLPRIANKVKLVIFDKDGTLINHDKIFGKWISDLVNNLFDEINKEDLLLKLGYLKNTNSFTGNSIVARGTYDDIRNFICKYLKKNTTYSDNFIKLHISNSWIPINITKENLVPCGDLIKIFNYLKSNNIKIAICTSDDRDVTLKTIELLNIKDKIDYIACGDDKYSSKPSPEPIWNICRNLQIDYSNTIMIGDTISDIHAGINAKCGRVIGVLSGGYDSNDLSEADVIFDDINFLVNYLDKIN